MAEFKYIEVQKSRDLGQILNVSFNFVSQNFKNLSISLVYIAGLPLLAALLYNVFIQWEAAFDFAQSGWSFSSFIEVYFISYFLHLSAYIFITVVPIIYMKIYIEKKSNDISVAEIWNYSSGLFLKIFLAELGVAIIIFFATFLFIIPGIFVAVAFSLVPIVIVTEKIGFVEAIGRSSNLISGHWWFTFGLIFVIYLIMIGIGMVFMVPVMIISFIIPIVFGNPELITEGYWPIRLISGVSEISSFFYAFFTIALTFHYYSLVEKKEATGLLSKIEALDDSTPPVEPGS